MALSGGMDSALAAARLKGQGWDVTGVHFLLPASCERVEARSRQAGEIAEFLQIPLEILDLREFFHREVILPFVEAYLEGRTPNPCVHCNPTVKFHHLGRLAERLGIPQVASGHYARVRRREDQGRVELLRGVDRGKDQSYFLHRLNQTVLAKIVFPLGEMTKEEARSVAAGLGLTGHAARESQEICFLEGTDYREFITSRAGVAEEGGEIVDQEGRVLGRHAGVFRFTIGQRQGLGIASARPYYVLEIQPDTRRVVVGRKEEVFSSVAVAEDVHWVEGRPPGPSMDATAQVRYRHAPAPGRMEVLEDHVVRFTFHEPQWAVTPGQALVCYLGDRVLGGGRIRGRDIAS